MTPIYSRDTGVAVASCIWVKNPYIKKGTLPATPEPTSMYISSSIILPVSSEWNNILQSTNTNELVTKEASAH